VSKVAASNKRHSAVRLAIFNHKGGVGKTTLTVNIAAALAGLGKRVLLVDADPQCNLTSYLIDDTVVDDLLDKSDSSTGTTLWSGLKSVVEATGDLRQIPAIPLSTKHLTLLPGDVRLSEFEAELNQMWGDCFQRKLKGFRGTTALSLLINTVAEKERIDFVMYDSGPNIGALTRIVLLDCDHFIVPAACDLFSVRALKTLGHTLSTWIRDWDTIARLSPDDIYFLPGKPRFLGYIPQRFRVYRGQVIAGQAGYLIDIEKHIFSDIVAVLRKIDPALASGPVSSFRLGQVKDYGQLAPASQQQGVPFKDVDSGRANQAQDADRVFAAIAEKIITRTTLSN
jgi:cellulose biosynthesis protein BcsQ